MSLDGLLLLDKPAGPTSHDLVDAVRRAAGLRRVGHAGTLDPPATGLLPVVLGRATRLVRLLPHSPKTYCGTLRLGLTTTTDDASGDVLESHAGPLPPEREVLDAAATLTGRLLQAPPAVSARKVGGRRLYRLARSGRQVAVEPRAVEVVRFTLSPGNEPGLFRFETEVSAGTYVRALARDLGARLGCGGVLVALRRLAIGPLRVEEALPAPELAGATAASLQRRVVPLDGMPLTVPALRLADADDVRRFGSGTPLPLPAGTGDGEHRVLDPRGRLLGIAEAGDGLLRPRVVLRPEEKGDRSIFQPGGEEDPKNRSVPFFEAGGRGNLAGGSNPVLPCRREKEEKRKK